MNKEQSILITYWWDRLYPLRRKFVRETFLEGLEKEDIEQECFMQLQKAIERYRPEIGVPFESYYKISLNGWRANQNRVKARMELAFGEDEMFFLADDRINIERDVEQSLLTQEVLNRVEELEEKERSVIKAYYLQNKKLTEIASELSISLKTVESRKQRALQRLRKKLCVHTLSTI